MFTEKIFKVVIISFLFGIPIVVADIQLIPSDATLSYDDHHDYDLIVEGNASYGNKQVAGKACIVMNRKQLKKVCKGDIVITPAIHSNWYSELNLAGGIIVEKGDETSQAIALGKKLDISVIVGASNATKKIIDGQTIVCDPVTRNIYHIGYSDPQKAHFDAFTISPQVNDYQNLHDKLMHPDKNRQPRVSLQESDYTLQWNDHIDVPVIVPEKNRAFKKIKSLFNSQFGSFKDWVFSTQKELILGRRSPRWVLKTFGGCDDFAIECIPLSFVFFDSDNILQVLKSLESDDNLEYIRSILDECKNKPGDVNWAGFVAHKKNAATVPVPENVDREKLIKDPKAYLAVQDLIDESERKIRIAAGLFARYCVEKKLVP